MVGGAYFALSGLVGECFPFTQVPMCAATAGAAGGGRRARDVPRFVLADAPEQAVDISEFTDFVGPPFTELLPRAGCRSNGDCTERATSLECVARDAHRWMVDHAGSPGPSGVAVAFVYVHLEQDAEGRIREQVMPAWTGRARRRR